eukprot:10246979-Heterocapsa_arctica.AAC.1
MNNTPDIIREHLQLNASRYLSYCSMRDAVMLFLRARRAGTLKAPGDNSAPMEVDAIGKGKLSSRCLATLSKPWLID